MIMIVIFIIFTLFFIELTARIYHYIQFLVHFKIRVFAEYPYGQFVEKADPPFYFRLKNGYKSNMVNINQHGMRGPELSSNPNTKRALFIGESPFFGVKLFNENDLWSFHLKQILDKNADSNWEIMNFSFPGYNTSQYKAFFQNELINLKPDIIILNIGGNDITQAIMFGDKWLPGITYPFDLILDLARKTKWWEKILNRSCFFFLLRRKYKEAKRKALLNLTVFKKEECFQLVFNNIEDIVKKAQSCGIKVVFLPVFPVYELSMSSESERKMMAIQSNWRQYVEIDGPPMFELMEVIKTKISPRLNIPVIEIRQKFWSHPERFSLYFDLYHLNKNGMKLLAEYLYEEINSIGYWK